MPKIAISTAPLEQRARRITCAVCGLLGEPAHPKAPVCAHCAEDYPRARALVEARVAGARRRADAARTHLVRAVDALDDLETVRWLNMRAALQALHAGEADPDTRAKVREMQTRIDQGKAPPALAAAWTAYEHNYWAEEAWAGERRRADIAIIHLEDVVIGEEEAA